MTKPVRTTMITGAVIMLYCLGVSFGPGLLLGGSNAQGRHSAAAGTHSDQLIAEIASEEKRVLALQE